MSKLKVGDVVEFPNLPKHAYSEEVHLLDKLWVKLMSPNLHLEVIAQTFCQSWQFSCLDWGKHGRNALGAV